MDLRRWWSGGDGDVGDIDDRRSDDDTGRAGTSLTRLCDRPIGGRRLSRALRLVAFSGGYGRLHRLAVDRLFAGAGHRVLDVGCGSGANFDALAGTVGDAGWVVGVDAREGMVRRASGRAAELRRTASPAGRCSVVRADPGSLPFPEAAFDRAFGTLAASAAPGAETAVAEVARVLRPGGRFVVLDARPFPTLPLAYLNPIPDPVSARTTESPPERDVPSLLRERFDPVHVDSFDGGWAFVATAELPAES